MALAAPALMMDERWDELDDFGKDAYRALLILKGLIEKDVDLDREDVRVDIRDILIQEFLNE